MDEFTGRGMDDDGVDAAEASVAGGVARLPSSWLDGSASSPSPLAVDNLLRFLAVRPGVFASSRVARDGDVIRVALDGRWWSLSVGLRDDGGASLGGVALRDARFCAPEDFPCVDDDFLAKFDAYWTDDRRVTDEGCPVGRDLRQHVMDLAREFAKEGRFALAPRVDAPGFDAALEAALFDAAPIVDPLPFVAALREAATTRRLATPRGSASLRLFAIPLSGPDATDALVDDDLFDGFVDSLKETGVASERSVLVVARRPVSADRFAEATPGLVAALVDAFLDAFWDAKSDGDVTSALHGRLGDLFDGELPTTRRRIGGPMQAFLVGVRVRERGDPPDYLEAFAPPRGGRDDAADWTGSARAYLPRRTTVGPPMGWNDAVVRSACELVHGEVDYERRLRGAPVARTTTIHVAVPAVGAVYVTVEEEDGMIGPFAVPSSMALCDLARFEGFLAETFEGKVRRVKAFSEIPVMAGPRS